MTPEIILIQELRNSSYMPKWVQTSFSQAAHQTENTDGTKKSEKLDWGGGCNSPSPTASPKIQVFQSGGSHARQTLHQTTSSPRPAFAP